MPGCKTIFSLLLYFFRKAINLKTFNNLKKVERVVSSIVPLRTIEDRRRNLDKAEIELFTKSWKFDIAQKRIILESNIKVDLLSLRTKELFHFEKKHFKSKTVQNVELQ